MGMWHVMIALHSVAGVAAFAIGVAALRPERLQRHPWLPAALLGLVAGLVVFMGGAMAAHWDELPAGTRLTFSGLVVLGLYLLHRAGRVTVARAARSLDDVGFVLISLLDGFVIVTALDLGAPPWLVAAAAVLAVLVGRLLVERAKRRAAPRPALTVPG